MQLHNCLTELPTNKPIGQLYSLLSDLPTL